MAQHYSLCAKSMHATGTQHNSSHKSCHKSSKIKFELLRAHKCRAKIAGGGGEKDKKTKNEDKRQAGLTW